MFLREGSPHYFSLIWCQVQGNLKAETSRAFLGMAWWLMEPVLYLSVFFFVFGVVFKRGGEGFVPFLLTGLIAFKWFSSSISQGASAITKNAGLINQIYLPKMIFPAIVVVMNTVKFLMIFCLLVPFLYFFADSPVNNSYLALPLIIVIQFVVNLAFAGLAAATVPLMPDLKVIIPSTMPMLLFLSGVIFKLSKVPDEYQWIIKLNPMVTIIESLRSVLLHGVDPDWSGLFWVGASGLVLLAVAVTLLRKYDRIYPKLVS